MKLVILDGFLANFDGLRLDIGGNEQVWYPATDPGQGAERIGDAEGVIVNRYPVTREVMEACPNLRYIGTLSTGVNMIDLAAAADRGITVCNVPNYSTAAVAQHTVSLLLDIASRISVFDHVVRSGGWCKGAGHNIVAVPTFELWGKTLGIFGAGEIGLSVARTAQALGMTVNAFRRTPPAGDTAVNYVDLDTLLEQSDVLSIHAPLHESTRRFFGREILSRMKDGAVLLNTARGAIIDEWAVAEALDSGKLRAYGGDVMTHEPPLENNPLIGHPRAVITPHVAWIPRETRERLLAMVSENIRAFLAGAPIHMVRP